MAAAMAENAKPTVLDTLAAMKITSGKPSHDGISRIAAIAIKGRSSGQPAA